MEQKEQITADTGEQSSQYRQALDELGEKSDAPADPPAEAPSLVEHETTWLRRELARNNLAALTEKEALQKWSHEQHEVQSTWAEQMQDSAVGLFGDVEPPAVAEAPAPEIIPLPAAKSSWRTKLAERGRGMINRFRSRSHQEAVEAEPAPLDVRQQNLELLEQVGELGRYLIPYYEKALELEPTLAQVAIRQTPRLDKGDLPRLFFAEPHFGHPPHEVFLRLEPDTIELQRTTFDRRPGLPHKFAELLGKDVGELTPEEGVVFAALHELGHGVDFVANEHRPHDYIAEINDTSTMPVPGVRSMPDFERPEVQKYIQDHWGELQSKYGVKTIEDVYQAQQRAYRDMPIESTADQFALRVLRAYRADRAKPNAR